MWSIIKKTGLISSMVVFSLVFSFLLIPNFIAQAQSSSISVSTYNDLEIWDPVKQGKMAWWEERNPEKAYYFWSQTPTDHPDYAYAMRNLGWHIIAKEMGRPADGVEYVNTALMLEPFEGDSWEDFIRVYLNVFNIPFRGKIG